MRKIQQPLEAGKLRTHVEIGPGLIGLGVIIAVVLYRTLVLGER